MAIPGIETWPGPLGETTDAGIIGSWWFLRIGGVMFELTSPAFRDHERLPDKYAGRRAGGDNISPPLRWTPPPEGTQSQLVVLVDRHPVARDFVHWAVTDLDPSISALPEGASHHIGNGARELRNTAGADGYSGPAPPPGTGPHEYETIVYALDSEVALPSAPSMEDIESAVLGHVIAEAELTGTYGR